jgi:ABC-type amino acid transport substrate-binding protein
MFLNRSALTRWLALLALLPAALLGLARPATAVQLPGPQELVFIAAANHTEPLSRFEQGVLTGGIIKDLGDALARRMGLKPRYLTMPSKRASLALRDGEGDLLCYTRPQWIGPDYRFTLPLIPNGEVVAARADAPRLKTLAELADTTVGTVLGYRYAEAEAALGPQLRRQDAPDMQANLRKLVVGRMQYAITDRMVLREHQRRQPQDGLREELVLNSYTAPCALSLRSAHSIDRINAALGELVADGELQRILSRHGQ